MIYLCLFFLNRRRRRRELNVHRTNAISFVSIFFFVFMVRSSLLVGVGINRESDWLSLVDAASRMEDAFPFGGTLRFFFFTLKKHFFGC